MIYPENLFSVRYEWILVTKVTFLRIYNNFAFSFELDGKDYGAYLVRGDETISPEEIHKLCREQAVETLSKLLEQV